MVFKLFSQTRSKGSLIEASIEVERYGTGVRRYRASPVRMLVRGKGIPFDIVDFMAYARTRRGARKRCFGKVVPFMKEKAKAHED